MAQIFSVQHNIEAMKAYRQLTMNNGTINKSVERLSSGYRINRAADDAVGLAVSEKMRTQVRGFQQAAINTQDAMSFLQVGDSALQGIHDTLQRIRELLVEAANDTYNDSDRSYIQLEIGQLLNEIDRINTSTKFNDKSVFTEKLDIVWLLDWTGSMLGEITTVRDNAFNFFDTLSKSGLDFRVGTVRYAAPASTNKVDSGGNGEFASNAQDFYNDLNSIITAFPAPTALEDAMLALNMTAKGYTFRSDAKKVFVVLTDADSDDAGSFGLSGGADGGPPATDLLQDTVANMNAANAVVHAVTIIPGEGFDPSDDVELNANNPNNIAAQTGGKIVSFSNNFGSVLGELIRNTKGVKDEFQIGPNENQVYSSVLPSSVSSFHLGVQDVTAATRTQAESSIGKVDTAIDTLSKKRAALGAEISRVEFALNADRVGQESMQAAESRIRDTDMAAEILEFTKAQAITQSSNAMLVQANLLPQQVLSLLG